jgi:hypothetical protein
MASVQRQTAVDHIQHLIVPDYVRRGIVASLYGGVRQYAQALSGAYVHVLADDDVLADPRVVDAVRDFATAHDAPEVIVVRVRKGTKVFPRIPVTDRPVAGAIDMASYLVRQDVFQRHACDYGPRYSGDVDHAVTLWAAGYRHALLDRLFLVGGTTSGKGDAHHRPAVLEGVC